MTELDQQIAAAFESQGQQQDVNKVYLTLLRTSLFVPIKKRDPSMNHIDEAEPFTPLFAKVEGNYFMLAFDTFERLTFWAGEEFHQIDYIEMTGKELIAGINDNVFFCLNVGTPHYKEFSPDEIKRLKTIVMKIDQLK